MKTVEDQLRELAAEVDRLKKIQAIKDKQLAQQSRQMAELQRRLSAQAGQIASLSTQISRIR